ncbi:MAG: hypothetical protein WCK31_02465 [bacterium]
MIKLKVYLVCVSILIFWVLSTLFSGIIVKDGLIGYILIGALFGIFMQSSSKVIRFLTLKENIFTSILFSCILSFALFFLLNTLSPLLVIKEGILKGFSTDVVVIKDFLLDKNTTLAIFSILCGTINALVDELRK